MSPPVPTEYDDILKFSQCQRFVVKGLFVEGGRENAIDICRGDTGLIASCHLKNQGSAALVAKGAFRFLTILSTQFSGTGYDVELGQFDNYWAPGRRPTSDVSIISCGRVDGKPLRVICWDADKPQCFGTDVQVTKVPKVIWYPYFLYRYFINKLKGVHK